jgi:hypothetical protein
VESKWRYDIGGCVRDTPTSRQLAGGQPIPPYVERDVKEIHGYNPDLRLSVFT